MATVHPISGSKKDIESKVTGSTRFASDFLSDLEAKGGDIIYAIPFFSPDGKHPQTGSEIHFVSYRDIFDDLSSLPAYYPEYLDNFIVAISGSRAALIDYFGKSHQIEIPHIPDSSLEGAYMSFGPRAAASLEGRITIAECHEDASPRTLITNNQMRYRLSEISRKHKIGDMIFPKAGGGFGAKLDVSYDELAILLSESYNMPAVVMLPSEMQHMSPPSVFRLDESKSGVKIKGELFTSEIGQYDPQDEAFLLYLNEGGIYQADMAGLDPAGSMSKHVQKNFTLGTHAIRSYSTCQPVTVVESIIDRLAFEGGHDPLEYRLDAMKPEARNVIEPMVELAKKKRDDLIGKMPKASPEPYVERVAAIGIGWQKTGFDYWYDRVKIELLDDKLVISTCYSDIGVSHSTGFLKIASQALGCSESQLEVRYSEEMSGWSTAASSTTTRFIAMMDYVRKKAEDLKPGDQSVLDYLKSSSQDGGMVFENNFNIGSGFDLNRVAYIVTVADMEINTLTGEIKTNSIDSYVDVGKVHDKEGVTRQIEGGAIQGMGEIFRGLQNYVRNADGYKNIGIWSTVLRANQVPALNVHILDSERESVGAGEIGIYAMYPTTVNAINQVMQKKKGACVNGLHIPLDMNQIYGFFN